MPAVPPVTIPEEEPIAAVPGRSLFQVPPPGASLKEVVKPEHTASVPEIGPGTVLTVTTAVVKQPVGKA